MLLVGLAGIGSRSDLERWIGSEVHVDATTLPAAGEGELYDFEAIGLAVHTTGGILVGTVIDVLPSPANDLWVVEATPADGGREILIPVVGAIVIEIDLKSRVAVIDPPAGLLEE